MEKQFKFILLFIFFISFNQIFGQKSIDQRVDSLLNIMTLEEKIGQMNQSGSMKQIERMNQMIKDGKVGSILNEVNPVRINEMQKIAVEESRLGIPILFARDVIHGFKTIFPIPLGQAASFNPEIVEKGARVAAQEASSVGIRWTFAPMIDISRDARWGRIAESCGEDVCLTEVMGVAMVKGFQGNKLSEPTSIAACAKHFVGYGAVESGKDYNSTNLTERQLRNIYLPPFEAAAKAGVASFMTSFNDNDGVPSTANSFILKDILRYEWGYDGFVVTDWASSVEMIAHGFAENAKEVAYKTLNAGVDMEMVGGSYLKFLPELVRNKDVDEKAIDQAVRNILKIKFELGLFENPYIDIKPESEIFYTKENLDVAYRSAVESAILLKNDSSTLPLKSDIKTILVTGPLADAPYDQMGTWVFDGEKNHTVTPLKALIDKYGDDVNIIYEAGLKYSRDNNREGIAKAVSAAENVDAVIAFVGEESILSGEAHSLADISLKGAQTELIKSLAKLNKPLITVVLAGRPLTIEEESKVSDALLYNFHPGTMGGLAIADLLFGKEVPSGKTPITFPRMVGQLPLYYAHNNTGRPAKGRETLIDKIPLEASQTSLGCTSFFLDAGFGPLYPFGYGLSYTTFAIENVSLSSRELKKDDVLTITFDVVNTGKFEGAEVPQLYIRDKVASVTRPVKELKDFTKVVLKPGERKTVQFELPISKLAFYNIGMKKVVEPGKFNLWVANNSQSGKMLEFNVIE